MAKTVAVSGKGGTGKSTLSGLIVRHLVKGGDTPVLAVDADPNTSLGEIIGMPAIRPPEPDTGQRSGQEGTRFWKS